MLYDAKRGRARGVRVIDALTMQETEFEARIVFLCASAIESARILLNSKSARFPDGLANSSGTLGRYVMDHHYGSGASGHYPGHTDRRTFGSRPNGIYIARFRNVKTQHPDFLRGYGMQGGSGRSRLGTRQLDAGLRRGVQAVADRRARPVESLGVRLGRDAAARGQPRHARPRT